MSAIQQLITEHMDIWTAADTTKRSGRGRASSNAGSVYGVKKLRELILELAVRGKLVPQDANDEPASELLKRIQAEKAKLISESKIKKDKPLAPIGEDEKPFDLPLGWVFVRNYALFQLRKGRIPKSLNEDELGLPYLDIDALDRNIIRRYSEELTCPQSTDKDILVVCDGSRSGLVLDGKNGIIGSTLSIIDTPVFIQNYIKLIFKQGFDIFNTSMKGAAIPHLDTQKLLQNPTALPPLAEQHRIVAKVDELMALCDELEAQHSNAAEAHEKLVSHLLGTLTQSQNADDFNANWQSIVAHFDTLFTTEASIDVLKQTLLQLAVMGKLVPQDNNDEPARDLLKRILAEKPKLIAEGKLKKEKSLTPITDDKKPFELPNGWEWVHLPDVTDYKVGKTPSTKSSVFWTDSDSGINWVSIADLNHYGVVTKTTKKVTELAKKEVFKSELVPIGTILMSFKLTLGKVSILEVPAFHNEAIISIYPSKAIDKSYLFKILPARANKGQSKSAIKGNTLNSESIAALLLPLPPLNEQHRIVAKIDELMVLCDQLKTRMMEASQHQQKIADILVAQAVD